MRRVPSQQGASWRVIEIALTFHYPVSRHSRQRKTHLFAQRPSGKWSKVLRGRPHVNELFLTLHKVAVCIKLLLGDLSLCTLQMTHLYLSLFLPLPCCPFVSRSLSLTSVTSWGERHANCASTPDSGAPRLPARPPAFSAPLNHVAASLHGRAAPLSVPLPGCSARRQHLLERQEGKERAAQWLKGAFNCKKF